MRICVPMMRIYAEQRYSAGAAMCLNCFDDSGLNFALR